MNAFQVSQDLGLTGTPQQIVDQLVASGLTARPILLADLLNVMNIPLKMLVRLPRQESDGSKWSGTAFNLIMWINEHGTQDQKDSINSWFSHITNDRNVTFDTTLPTIAAPFWAMAQAFGGQPTFPSAADFKAVADLGGGWLFDELTVDQFTAQRNAAIAAEAAQTIREAAWTVMDRFRNQIGSTEQADGIVAMRAMLDGLEAE